MTQINDNDPVLSMTTDEFAEYLADKREKLFNRAAAVATKQTRSTLMMRSLAKKSVQTLNAKRSTANKVK
jgi:ribosomal protein L29